MRLCEVRPRCCRVAPCQRLCRFRVRVSARRAIQRRIFTARAATSSTVVAEIADSVSIIIFTRRVSGIASVGLNAIELVNEMYT